MRVFPIAIILFLNSVVLADTQDYVKCDVIMVKTDVVYFDAGSSVGVAKGETFEILYDDMVVATGKIDWADKYISRSEQLDLTTIAGIYFNEGLKARIKLSLAQANRGGFLVIPYLSDLNLDPASINTPEEKMIGRLLYRGLLTRDVSGKIVPDLVGTYEIRGLTYTFYIDPMVKFNSGKPVQATDVAYSIEQLALSPKLTPASCFVLMIKGAEEYRHRVKNEITGIFLINENTISITLKAPFPTFEDYLAGPAGYIIPRPGLEAPGGSESGAGMYRIKWRNSDGLAVESVDGSGALLDSIRFLRFRNLDEAALSFELGRLDILPILGEPTPKFVSSESNTSVTAKTNCSAVLGVNSQRDYQKNLAFSKALSFMLDRDTIIRVILGGSGRIPDDLVVGYEPGQVGVNPDSADYYLKSIEKLPPALNLYVDSHYPSLANIARYISGQLQNKGIKVKEKTVDLSAIEEDRAKAEIDLYLNYFSPVSSDPECELYPLYNYQLSGQTNYLYLRDDALQVFIKNLRSETDPERRDILAAGLLHSVAKEPPAVVLYQPYLTTVMKTDIAGIRPLREGYLDLRGTFIESGK